MSSHKRQLSNQSLEDPSHVIDSKRTYKRQRPDEADRPEPMTSVSKIETLPVEILERIFVDSANGNLLLAAPRIAVKLSRNESLYRVAFAMAFYNHRLRDFLEALRIASLIPDLALPMRSWDVRSMTKAVLRARWCTCGWTLNLIISARKERLDRIARSMSQETRQGFLELMVKLPEFDDSLPNCQWDDGVDNFNLVDYAPEHDDPYLGALSQKVDDSALKAMFMQCVPINAASDSHFGTKFADSSREAPLKMYIEAYLREEVARWDSHGELWPTLDCLAQRSFRDLTLEEETSKDWLRYMIAIDYYFHPEDHPFKISPSAFRQAAILDACDYNDNPEHILDYQIPRVLLLFELDPLSTPHRDPALLRWAAVTRDCLFDFRSLFKTSGYELVTLDAEIEQCEADYEFGTLMLEYEELKLGRPRAKAMYDMFQRFRKYLLFGTIDFLPDYNNVSIFLMQGVGEILKSRALDPHARSYPRRGRDIEDLLPGGTSRVEERYQEDTGPVNEAYQDLGVEGPHEWDYEDYEYGLLEGGPHRLVQDLSGLDLLHRQPSKDTDLVGEGPPAWFQPAPKSYICDLSSF
ncbi:hypothetical protein LTR10_023287 [Elasticomyces elasticus]|uniref:F-box domain-containing protein n=1 Tax=Exophiala sideris TaxID=1016849 RepID=A0ABR0J186_9EURO|nr:hypothetical protein LTR10_023287 [Elasticomyces elasticus]KAK5023091.1 hypothetical protein LTS07_009584 [Exophiala sideris]KAK5026816.1 hypothetical protein LTR13_009856 [Exophiala sideris]KAK5052469.1 hypothetical protein LTR69_009807 [Exophiala sideris]KAK5178254.1 hypothetical protein LTR44_009338 [Eurotiomycetes sp. CCFEE 6388]